MLTGTVHVNHCATNNRLACAQTHTHSHVHKHTHTHTSVVCATTLYMPIVCVCVCVCVVFVCVSVCGGGVWAKVVFPMYTCKSWLLWVSNGGMACLSVHMWGWWCQISLEHQSSVKNKLTSPWTFGHTLADTFTCKHIYTVTCHVSLQPGLFIFRFPQAY